MLFAGSSVLLVLLHRAQARAQANAPYTLTPPIMVRPCAPLSGLGHARLQPFVLPRELHSSWSGDLCCRMTLGCPSAAWSPDSDKIFDV